VPLLLSCQKARNPSIEQTCQGPLRAAYVGEWSNPGAELKFERSCKRREWPFVGRVAVKPCRHRSQLGQRPAEPPAAGCRVPSFLLLKAAVETGRFSREL
jgi:hypothetical protein